MKIAITGAAGYFGRKIIEKIEEIEEIEKIVGISRRKFSHNFGFVDLIRMNKEIVM